LLECRAGFRSGAVVYPPAQCGVGEKLCMGGAPGYLRGDVRVQAVGDEQVRGQDKQDMKVARTIL